MSCGKTYQKLWMNYQNKYGDFRERARAIQNDHKYFKQFQLPYFQRRSSILRNSYRKLSSKQCDSTECYHSSLNKIDRENLEKLIQAENFPENIFSNQSQSIINHHLQESTIKKSEFVINELHDRTHENHLSNPYAQWLKRIRQEEKMNKEQSNIEFFHHLSVSTISPSIHQCLEQFLSFLNSLDNDTVHSIDKQTIINLFSLDNHLSSSIDIPITIQQLNIIPKSILQELDGTTAESVMQCEYDAKKIRKK